MMLQYLASCGKRQRDAVHAEHCSLSEVPQRGLFDKVLEIMYLLIRSDFFLRFMAHSVSKCWK